MSTVHRTGGPDDATISVVLTRTEALHASVALLQCIRQGAETFAEHADDAAAGGVRSQDLAAIGRELVDLLAAIERVGWPHEHLEPMDASQRAWAIVSEACDRALAIPGLTDEDRRRILDADTAPRPATAGA